MKKLLALVLTLALVAAMGTTTAFAATIEQDGGIQTIDVTAKYTSGATSPDVVSVDVEWGAMQFTYSVSGTKEWNPADHSYADKTTDAWTSNGNTVKVTNHSNIDVEIGFAYAPEANSTVTGAFTYDKTAADNTVALSAGEEGKYSAADNVTATLTLAGTVPSTQTNFAKVGTITVTIGK